MDDCFFCKIQTMDKSNLMVETDEFFSLYDAAPVNPGHSIVIPKRHIVSFFELGPSNVVKLYETIHLVKKRIDQQLHPAGYNIGINDGRSAGRSIDHLHVHVIPRYDGDMDNPRGGVRNIMGRYIPPAVPRMD